MKRHISIFTFLLGAVFAVGSVADLRADESVRAWFVSMGGNWNANDTTHINPSGGNLLLNYKDQPLVFTALPPPGYQVTRWLWNDSFSFYLKESDMSEITGSVQTRWVSDDLLTCTLLYSGDGQRALGVRFDAMPLTVTFDRNGGSGTMSPVTGNDYDSEFDLPTNAFTKTGHSFANWTNAVGKVFKDGQSVKGSDFWNPAITNFSAELVAVWKANTYTVTFNENGGETPSPTSKIVTYDSTYGDLATCTREGWQFKGWYTATDGGTKIEPTTKVTIISNQTLYAQWAQKFTVTFREDSKFNDTTPKKDGVLKVESVVKGDSATPPADPVHTGYRFTGWSGNYTGVTRDENVYATYQANSYRVVFHANDGSEAEFSQNFEFGTPGILPSNPWRRTGYGFEGWAQTPDATKPDCYQPGDPFTLPEPRGFDFYAIWKPISYTIAFEANGGGGTMEPTPLAYGAPFMVPECGFTEPTGCEFKWWSAEIGGVATNFEVGAIVSNLTSKADDIITFKAEWVGHYTVAFDANGGTGTMTNLTYEMGVEYALPSNAFTKTGYRFYGWATNRNDAVALKKPVYTNGQAVVDLAAAGGICTFFAEWATNRYTVVFNPNGDGVRETMEPQDFLYDQEKELSPNRFTRGELWSFAGWSNSVGRVFENRERVSNLCADDGGTVELFARWTSELGPLSEAMGCDNLKWVDGDVQEEKGGWVRCETDGCDREGRDGYPPCVMQLGPDYDFGKWMHANITTNGTLSFWYRLSDETARIVVNVCSSGANPTTVGSLFGESGKWRHATFDIPFQPLQGYCIEITHLDGGDVYIDQMTWTPEGSEPKYVDVDSPVTGFSMADGKLVFAFNATNDEASAYHLLGTNDLVAPMPWPMVFEIGKKPFGPHSFEIPIKENEPKMFYRIRALK